MTTLCNLSIVTAMICGVTCVFKHIPKGVFSQVNLKMKFLIVVLLHQIKIVRFLIDVDLMNYKNDKSNLLLAVQFHHGKITRFNKTSAQLCSEISRLNNKGTNNSYLNTWGRIVSAG